ncbi:MAG: hypothetical protein JWN48_5647 [Myxococcaceae bacterium]|nr:hypothetical protein [Myxococcaceae bacterium]
MNAQNFQKTLNYVRWSDPRQTQFSALPERPRVSLGDNPAAAAQAGYKPAVLRFFLGFLLATVLWAATAFGLYRAGLLAYGAEAPDEVADPGVPGAGEGDDDQPDKKRGRRPRRSGRSERTRPARTESASAAGGSASAASLPRGEATTGDDLDWDGDRNMDMAAGEEQLSGKAIEAGFDSAMSKIRRCLILVPAEGDVTGKLTFGMRVGSDGAPKAVNLSGPAVVTSGESGSCLRKAAEAIRFAKFAGPDMLFKYPVTLR